MWCSSLFNTCTATENRFPCQVNLMSDRVRRSVQTIFRRGTEYPGERDEPKGRGCAAGTYSRELLLDMKFADRGRQRRQQKDGGTCPFHVIHRAFWVGIHPSGK